MMEVAAESPAAEMSAAETSEQPLSNETSHRKSSLAAELSELSPDVQLRPLQRPAGVEKMTDTGSEHE
jgi:hypothetical protein